MSAPRWNRRSLLAALGAVEALLAMDDETGKVRWPDGVANSDMTAARDMLRQLNARHAKSVPL